MAALERGWGAAAGRGWAGVPLRGGGGEGGCAEPSRLLLPRGEPRRKRRMDAERREEAEEEEGRPASKKRRRAPTPPLPQQPPPPLPPAAAATGGPWVGAGGRAPDAPCEEMEDAPSSGEQQCEAARRRLREIEARITEEEEEEEEGPEGAPRGALPTLVLSDTLRTGLQRDYAGDLTQRILESMSRPSMELVLWKPLPDFLAKKAKPAPLQDHKPMAERSPAKPATLGAAFGLPAGQFSAPRQGEMPSAFYSPLEAAGCSEEEMEL